MGEARRHARHARPGAAAERPRLRSHLVAPGSRLLPRGGALGALGYGSPPRAPPPKPPPPRPKGSAFKAATARETTPKTKQEAALAQSDAREAREALEVSTVNEKQAREDAERERERKDELAHKLAESRVRVGVAETRVLAKDAQLREKEQLLRQKEEERTAEKAKVRA